MFQQCPPASLASLVVTRLARPFLPPHAAPPLPLMSKQAGERLYDACWSNVHAAQQLAKAEAALMDGADVEYDGGRDGTTPLMEAACRPADAGHARARLLLMAGADADAMNKNGNTPLHYAAYSGSRLTAVSLRGGRVAGQEGQGRRHTG